MLENVIYVLKYTLQMFWLSYFSRYLSIDRFTIYFPLFAWKTKCFIAESFSGLCLFREYIVTKRYLYQATMKILMLKFFCNPKKYTYFFCTDLIQDIYVSKINNWNNGLLKLLLLFSIRIDFSFFPSVTSPLRLS